MTSYRVSNNNNQPYGHSTNSQAGLSDYEKINKAIGILKKVQKLQADSERLLGLEPKLSRIKEAFEALPKNMQEDLIKMNKLSVKKLSEKRGLQDISIANLFIDELRESRIYDSNSAPQNINDGTKWTGEGGLKEFFDDQGIHIMMGASYQKAPTKYWFEEVIKHLETAKTLIDDCPVSSEEITNNDELQKKLNRALNKNSDLQIENTSLKEDNDKLLNKTKQDAVLLLELNKKLKSLDSEFKDLKSSKDYLAETYKNDRHDLQYHKSWSKTHEEKYLDFKRKFEDSQQQIQRLEQENHHIRLQLNQPKETNINTTLDLEKKILKLDAAVSQLSQEKQSIESEYNDLSAISKQATDVIDNFQRENTALKQEIESLKAAAQSARSEATKAARSEIESLQQLVNDLLAQQEKSERELKLLKK